MPCISYKINRLRCIQQGAFLGLSGIAGEGAMAETKEGLGEKGVVKEYVSQTPRKSETD